MSRYIDADKLEGELFRDGIAGIFLGYPRRRKYTIGEIRGMLKNERIAPTADVVEVRHGRWLSAYEYALKIGATDEKLIENAKEDKRWKFCCHCEQPVKWDYHYCPTCGAKMDGERREENDTRRSKGTS